MQFIITLLWLVTFFTGANDAKKTFTFHVPRLNDAESGPLLPPQGRETKVSSCSVFVGTPTPEGFPALHGSADRQAAEQSQGWDHACSQSSLSQQLSLRL